MRHPLLLGTLVALAFFLGLACGTRGSPSAPPLSGTASTPKFTGERELLPEEGIHRFSKAFEQKQDGCRTPETSLGSAGRAGPQAPATPPSAKERKPGELREEVRQAFSRRDPRAAILAMVALRECGETAYPDLTEVLSMEEAGDYHLFAFGGGPDFSRWCLEHPELPTRLRTEAAFVLPFHNPKLAFERASARDILAEPDPEVAEEWVEFSVNFADDEVAFGELARVATQSPSPELRRQALTGLGRHPESPQALLGIQQIASSDPDPELRQEALNILGKIYRGFP